MIERLRTGSGGRIDLPTGTVYPALHRLERAGLICSQWSSDSGRRRRSCELTPAGIAGLDTTRSGWEEFSTAVSASAARLCCSLPAGQRCARSWHNLAGR
ncbi:PadR family transcriptional regulator [Pseudonocardia sp. GCM10023141]|uniref:PadR family transcriptional regulator n=1 Tax=Pseudonocardia sp. GCM10023141 TaxID=3252653 RepID=UPI0036145D86